MRGITKHFGNLEALSTVSFRLRRGSLHALLGENGAGKTTLMRIAFGMIPPDAGEIHVDGMRQKIRSPRDAIRLGIGMVHQHFMLVPAMTVAENVELGGRGHYDALTSAVKLKLLEEKTGLVLDPSATVGSLGVPAQQRLEIIKALAHNAHVLILDEPTAVLAPAVAEDLLTRIRKLVDHGLSVVLITHKLRDAREYADDISVLRSGRLMLTGSMSDFSEAQLVSTMLGQDPREVTLPVHATTSSAGKTAISLRSVGLIDSTGVRRLRDVDLDIRAGEIVGIAALEGSASQLLRILAGRFRPTEGQCIVPHQVGFIAEDRRRDSLVPGLSLYENVAVKDSGSRRGVMRWPDIREQAASLVKRFDVRASDIDMRAQNLSGGNQQKLILGRELADSPVAIVAENPTRGLDINASEMIHDRLRQARDAGSAIVFYSSDIDELVDLADRVVVLRDGTLAEVPLDSRAIGNALLMSAVTHK